ncbi:hypothetical protein C7271_23655 [filamentous cyanobacterium CCP5]|nr:hypothetical protein C7271_23655 [filamentous cyanobacterium CCP5]
MPQEQTRTPQNISALFPLSGHLEDVEVIAEIAKVMIDDPNLGLAVSPIDEDEQVLLDRFRLLLDKPQETTREQWAALKEESLLLAGSAISDCVSFLCSGLRTPAVAEATLRSAANALIKANQHKAKRQTQQFFRRLIKGYIRNPE